MAESQENIKNFIPSEKQMEFLEVFLNQETKRSIEDMAEEIGINPATYYLWKRNHSFNQWFYEQIQVQKHRHAPEIISNLIRKAKTDKATPQEIELALKVLDLYTPTNKQVNENYNYDGKKLIEEIKKKAEELSKIEVTESGLIHIEEIDAEREK
jgi:predicted Zn-dependent peptidase